MNVLDTPFADRPEWPYNIVFFDPSSRQFTSIQIRAIDTVRAHERVIVTFGPVQVLGIEQVKGVHPNLSPVGGVVGV